MRDLAYRPRMFSFSFIFNLSRLRGKGGGKRIGVGGGRLEGEVEGGIRSRCEVKRG